jgi:hypothetical protein
MKTPPLDAALAKRIRLVRRDLGDLLFHFTRHSDTDRLSYKTSSGRETATDGSASSVLYKILHEGKLLGTGTWTGGHPCVCFTEAPIAECASIFALNELAASVDERPRYDPYGIAVSKTWLYAQGGRPVIYDHPAAVNDLADALRYRFVPFDPPNGVDFTWEREWRVKGDSLTLDPRKTLVIVPTADEAFQLIYDFANIEIEWDVEGSSGRGIESGSYHSPKWLAVSLDIFGLTLGA